MAKRNLSYDDGMMLWKSRDAYRVQTVLLTAFYLPQFFFALFGIYYLSRGFWWPAASAVAWIAALWGVRWVLCTGVPWAVRWGWRVLRGLTGMVGLLLVGLCGLGGCMEAAQRINELHGYNCRPEVTQKYGSCMPTRGTMQ